MGNNEKIKIAHISSLNDNVHRFRIFITKTKNKMANNNIKLQIINNYNPNNFDIKKCSLNIYEVIPLQL